MTGLSSSAGIAAVVFTMCAPRALVAQDSGIPIGSAAPVVSVANIDGKTVSLAEFIGKKPVLLEFWASWCGNCKELEPQLLGAAKKHGANVQFIAIAVGINQTLARVQRYMQEHKYPFPVLWDKDGALAIAYDAPATSYVVLIDKAGKVVYTGVGGDQNLEAALKKVL